MRAFLLAVALVHAASYKGTLNVQDTLYSGAVSFSAESSLSCSSFNSPNSTVVSVVVNALTTDTLYTDKLIAKNGVLRLSNNVQVTGKVVYGQATSFLEKEETPYMSFLGQSRNALEAELSVKNTGLFSFIQIPGSWNYLGTYPLESGKVQIEGLGPHTAISFSTNIYFEDKGSAFLVIDGVSVWMESCEWCTEEWSSPIAVTLAHGKSHVTAELKSTGVSRVGAVDVAIRS
jgi:hypothetical protein